MVDIYDLSTLDVTIQTVTSLDRVPTALFGILDMNYIQTDIIQKTSFYAVKDYHLLDLFFTPHV